MEKKSRNIDKERALDFKKKTRHLRYIKENEDNIRKAARKIELNGPPKELPDYPDYRLKHGMPGCRYMGCSPLPARPEDPDVVEDIKKIVENIRAKSSSGSEAKVSNRFIIFLIITFRRPILFYI